VALSVALAAVFGTAMLVPSALAINTRWKAADQSGNTNAPAWLDQAFGAMDGNAVVISWWSYSTPMWYGELIQGRRTDVLIIDDSNAVWDELGSLNAIIDSYLGTRPVYVIRQSESDIQNLGKKYAITPVGRPGNLFLVTGRLGTTP
jgi:hypothetical protein